MAGGETAAGEVLELPVKLGSRRPAAVREPREAEPPDELRRRLRAAPVQSALLLSPRESLAPVWIELAPDAAIGHQIKAVAEREIARGP